MSRGHFGFDFELVDLALHGLGHGAAGLELCEQGFPVCNGAVRIAPLRRGDTQQPQGFLHARVDLQRLFQDGDIFVADPPVGRQENLCFNQVNQDHRVAGLQLNGFLERCGGFCEALRRLV